MVALSRRLADAWFHSAIRFIGNRPKNPVTLDGAARAEVEVFLDAVDIDR